MRAGSEFFRVWAMATAISLEIDEADMEEATITTTWAADDGGEDEDEVKNRPANMLLKVKCSWDNYLKQNPMIVRLTRKVLSPHEPAMRWIKKKCQPLPHNHWERIQTTWPADEFSNVLDCTTDTIIWAINRTQKPSEKQATWTSPVGWAK